MPARTARHDARQHHPLATPLLVTAALACTARAGLIDSRTQVGAWHFTDASVSEQTGDATLSLHGQAEIVQVQGEEALSLAGDGHAQITHDASMQLDEGVIRVRFMPTGLGDSLETLFSKDGDGETAGDLDILLEPSDEETDALELTAMLEDERGDIHAVSSAPISTNQWHELQLAFGEGGMLLMIDGEIVDANAHPGGIAHTRGDIALGAQQQQEQLTGPEPLPGSYTGSIATLEIFGSRAVPGPGSGLLLCVLALAIPRRRTK